MKISHNIATNLAEACNVNPVKLLKEACVVGLSANFARSAMKSASLRLSYALLILCFGMIACRKAEPVKPATTQAFGQAAKDFCDQVVECEREEVRQVLADDVQRRTYLEGRLTEAACIEARLRRIEQVPESAEALSGCTKALSGVRHCGEKRRLLHDNEHCRYVLNL